MPCACALVIPLLAFHPARHARAPPAQQALASRAKPARAMFGDGFLSWLEDELVKRRMTLSRPERIILVRHGLSEGNIDRSAYSRTPDSQIPLTERGFAQAAVAGLQIRQLVGNESIRIFYSPYLRARQTMLAILRAFDGQSVQISSEPRLREQDFGNFQDIAAMTECKAMRNRFGRFFYRFPNGESGADVYDRVSTWLESLFREMEFGGINEDTTVVLVTHGLTARLFLMRWYHWSVEIFEETRNPGNAQLMVMEREMTHGGVYYNLTKESREQITLPEKAVKHEDVERRRQMKISGNMFSFSQKAAKMNSFAASDENSTAA
mmetsp:Transcript_35548/g.86377  ORF Transcript_35548/g.86377 Transcript_35548/m.86377 type:complete len:323 (+) Transcript_35548:177-1145(+)